MRRVPWYRSIIFKQISIFLLTVVPLLCVAAYVYTVCQKESIEAITETSLSRDASICESLFDDLSNCEFKMHNFCNDGDLYLLSDLWEQYDISERARRIIGIQEKLYWMGTGETYTNDYRLYLLRSNTMIYTNGYQPINTARREIIERLIANNQSLLIENGDFYIYVKSLTERDSNALRFLGCIKIPQLRFQRMADEVCSDPKTQCLLLVNGEVYQRRNIDETTEALLLSEYARRAEDMDAAETFTLTREGKSYFCSAVRSHGHDVALVTLRTYDDMFARTESGLHLLLGLVALSVIAIAFFVLYISHYVRRPITTLGEAFSRVERDATQLTRITVQSNDEFNYLYASFNDMSERLRHSIDDVFMKTIELQRSELKQLQAQIDPHFLYNTLFILQRKVIHEDYAGTAELSGLLGEYFRYVNRGDRDFVSLHDEVAHMHAYIRIQRMRFTSRFQFLYEACPQEYQALPVPRMILQPIAENSIEYGMKNVEEGGVIALSFRDEDNKLLIILEDSGSVTDEQLEQMNRNLRPDYSPAVVSSTVNIMRRLRLFYGEGFGLRFERSGYGGLRAVVAVDRAKKEGTVL